MVLELLNRIVTRFRSKAFSSACLFRFLFLGIFINCDTAPAKRGMGEGEFHEKGKNSSGAPKGMKKRDLIAAACWVILGVTVTVWSGTFPFGTWESVGPAVLPFGCGLILILLGSALFFQVWKKAEGGATKVLAPLIPSGPALRRVAMSVGGMLLAAVLFGVLGFVLSVFCLTLLLLRGIEQKKWGVDIFYALFLTLGCYILFQVLFKTTLPKGFLGF